MNILWLNKEKHLSAWLKAPQVCTKNEKQTKMLGYDKNHFNCIQGNIIYRQIVLFDYPEEKKSTDMDI